MPLKRVNVDKTRQKAEDKQPKQKDENPNSRKAKRLSFIRPSASAAVVGNTTKPNNPHLQ